MRISMTGSTCGAAILLAAQLHAADGVVITETTTVGGKTRTTRMQVTRDHVRTEIASASGDNEVVIFDATTQVMWMVNYDKKTYTEMTKAEADKMGAQMGDANAKVQEMLKSLPPEQRAQMEQMMKGRGASFPSAQPQRIEYKRAGADKVGKWACAKYEGFRETQKASELCTVDVKDLGISATDLDAARQMSEFFGKMRPQNAESLPAVGTDGQGFIGFPVRRVTTTGNVQSVTEVSDVSRQNLPDSAFALPSDFKKVASPFAR